MKVYRQIIFIISLLMFLVFQSCSNSHQDTKKIEIKFWGMGAEGENVQKLLPKFYEEYPDIKVTVQSIPWTAAQEKLISAYASDNLPDIFQLGNTWIPQFVALDAIQALDTFINNSKEINSDNYFNGIWETNIINDKVYGIPWYIDTRIVFYRKDILAKAGYDEFPRTWMELYDASKKIKDYYGSEEKYAIYLPTNEWATFIIFAMQNKSSILRENDSYGAFSQPEFKEAFEYLINFHKEGLAPVGISQVTNVYQAFAEEYFAIYISGPWNIPEFKKWMKGDLSDKWATAPMPSNNGAYPGTSLAGGASLVINRNSKHKTAVWNFIEFLSKREIQLEFYSLVNDLPSVKSSWEDTLLTSDKYMQAFFEQFHNVTATPKINEWEQIAFSKVQQYAEMAVRSQISIDKVLLALDNDVNKILEKRRWLLEKNNE